jgi:hypothetical protein
LGVQKGKRGGIEAANGCGGVERPSERKTKQHIEVQGVVGAE